MRSLSSSWLAGDPFRPPKKKQVPAPKNKAPGPAMPAGPFKVLVGPDAQKGYEELPGNVRQSMNEVMRRLESWPEVSGVRSFFGKGYAPNKFRMKTWDWRIEFEVRQKEREIWVLRIGHRDTFYDEYH